MGHVRGESLQNQNPMYASRHYRQESPIERNNNDRSLEMKVAESRTSSELNEAGKKRSRKAYSKKSKQDKKQVQ